MAQPLDDYPIEFTVTYEQSATLYKTLKSVFDKYMDENNKSGSAAGVPPPSCFEGFWSEYHNEFKSSVNSNPLFRATAEGVTHRKESVGRTPARE